MLQRISDEVCVLTLFNQFPEIIHGFSLRDVGTMNSHVDQSHENLKQFSHALQIPDTAIVRMHQVHSDKSSEVTQIDTGKILEGIDGLYTKEKNVFLGVVTADCVPVFVYDSKRHIVSALHAGWKGVYNDIVPKLLNTLFSMGSNKENIYLGLGPSIRSCCYTIEEERAKLFQEKFSPWSDVFLTVENGEIHCSLQTLLIKQVEVLGITLTRIDDASTCTKDNADVFFSYRNDKKEPIDEFIGIIGTV